MTQDQIIVFTVLGTIMALLVWGRWRYDLVAFSGLLVATVLGVVKADDAFSGFGHPATIVIATVLIVSRGLSNAGAIDLLARSVTGLARNLTRHILVGGLLGFGPLLTIALLVLEAIDRTCLAPFWWLLGPVLWLVAGVTFGCIRWLLHKRGRAQGAETKRQRRLRPVLAGLGTIPVMRPAGRL